MVRFRPNLSLALRTTSEDQGFGAADVSYHPAPRAPKKQPPVNVETTAPVKDFDGSWKCALNVLNVNTEDMIPLEGS